MRREEIIQMIKTNSEIDFIKDNIRINIERILPDASIGRIFINGKHFF